MEKPENNFNLDSGLSAWKRKAIRSQVTEQLEELMAHWDLEDENIFDNNSLNIDVSDSFGASVDGNSITISEPDLYRAGMHKIFDSEEVINTVDDNYPVPFHDVIEELGQFLGRKSNDHWSYPEDSDNVRLEDAVKDEMYGIMALSHFYPEFVEHYTEKFSQNIETIKEINSEEQLIPAYNGGEEFEPEDLISIMNMDFLPENFDYTRAREDIPTPFAIRAAAIIVENDKYSVDDLGISDINDWRKRKLYEESEPWLARLTASKSYNNLNEEYSDSEIIDRNLPTNEVIMDELREVEEEHELENPYL